MAFKQAERAKLFLRCAVFGPSGSGKTMTAMRMAKGIADKMGVPYAVIDTESRSASKYADRFSFAVDDLERKTIDHYIASMNEAAKAGYKVLVIDSLSHAWRELTEEVDRITQASSSRNSLFSWGKVSPKQKKLVEAILNFPGHLIVTMRSKTEWVIGEGKDGKTAPVKLGLAPEQGKGIEYEFDLLIEMNQQHVGTVTKDRTGKFQDETINKPDEDFGVSLLDWLTNGKEINNADTASNLPNKPQTQKTGNVPAKSKGVNTKAADTETPNLKEQGDKLINEIGSIFNSVNNGAPCFSETEKEEGRQIIRGIKLDNKGIAELKDFKIFLSDELEKRGLKNAA